MTAWTEADLRRFGAAEEIAIAAVRKDATVRAARIIWVAPAGRRAVRPRRIRAG